MRPAHTTWSFSSTLAIVVVATAAWAGEPTAADVESAKAAFVDGITLREHKDLAGALAKFRAAYALVPTPITGIEVGRALLDLGHVLEGRELLLDVSRMPKKHGESEKAEESRQEAARLADQARSRLASLSIETSSADGTASVDDVPIPKDAMLAPRVLDPGHHVIVIRTKDHVGRAEVTLAEGEQKTVHVDATDAPQLGGPEPGALKFHPGTPFWASVLITGVGLVTGIATGIPAIATAGSLSSQCNSLHVCPQSSAGTLDASLALGWISTIGFAVAGVGAVVSIVTFAVTGKRDAPKTALRLGVGPGTLSLSGTFR